MLNIVFGIYFGIGLPTSQSTDECLVVCAMAGFLGIIGIRMWMFYVEAFVMPEWLRWSYLMGEALE